MCTFYSLLLFFFCGFGAIKVQLFRNKFRQMHNYCILRVQRNNLGLYVFWNKKNSSKYFGPWTENFRLHGKLSAAVLFEYQLEYLLMLSKSFYGSWVKNAFYVSGKTIWGKTSTWTKNLFRSNFETWTDKCRPFLVTLWQARQNCTLHLQRITLKRVYRF